LIRDGDLLLLLLVVVVGFGDVDDVTTTGGGDDDVADDDDRPDASTISGDDSLNLIEGLVLLHVLSSAVIAEKTLVNDDTLRGFGDSTCCSSILLVIGTSNSIALSLSLSLLLVVVVSSSVFLTRV